MKSDITGGLGVLGENDNGRWVIDFFAEGCLCIGNTYFEQKSLHKYIRVARGQDGLEVKSRIDLVLKKNMLRYMQGVRGLGPDGQSQGSVGY